MSQPQTLITRREVQRLTGFSRPWIYSKMKAGKFPRPIRIGSKAVRWVESEILEWIEERILEDRERRADLAGG